MKRFSRDGTNTFYSFTFSLLLLVSPILCEEYGEWCGRVPADTTANKTPGDNGFRIKLAGRPPPEKYIPDQVYTISLNGTYTNQKLLGFYLVAVPLNARDETTAIGTFQHLNFGVTKFDRDCPHIVTHTYQQAMAGVEVLWTAPPPGVGCVEFRATVVEYPDIWYKDDGALTRVFCEDTGKVEHDKSPEMLSDCCACGSAKYLMTFYGLWSRQTHPKDYPTHKRLLHWSNIVGASHSKDYLPWQYGEYASKGIKEVCEFGYSRTLENEMKQNSDSIRTVIKTTGIWWKDPEGLRQSRWARFSVDKTNHLLSMLSMLGPSPDWCSGVSGLDLCLSNCTWAGDFTVDLYPWDAGTDDGATYMSPNSVSHPQQKIHKITESFPDNPTSPFYGSAPLQPLARLEVKRVSPKVGSLDQCEDVDDEESDFGGDNNGDLSEMEMKKKLMMMQGKCVVSDWLDWSDCTVTCGVGMRFRKRMFLMDGIDETMCPDTELMQKENCIGTENTCEDPDAECSATEWSEWSPCSVTCGKGIQERRRYYMMPESAASCSRDMAGSQMCIADIMDCSKAFMFLNMTAICALERSVGPCRGFFTRWYFDTQMQKCLPFTYGGCRGNNNRFQTMAECQQMCGQAGLDERPTDPPSDPVDCMMSPWTEWSVCSQTCGKSYQYKTRFVKREPENGGKACPGRIKKRNKCDVPKCSAVKANAVDCMVTEWSSWSECSTTCGDAVKTKRRMIKREPENGGKKCPKKLEREKVCKVKKCSSPDNNADHHLPPYPTTPAPLLDSLLTSTSAQSIQYHSPVVDKLHDEDSRDDPPPTGPRPCLMGEWTDWSACPPRICVQEQSRRVLRREDPGGLTCGPRLRRRHCSVEDCYMHLRASIPNYRGRRTR